MKSMQSNNLRILVFLVEPMLYGNDRINEVYMMLPYEFKYVYFQKRVTGKGVIDIPKNAYICEGSRKAHKRQICKHLEEFQPDFVVINGYAGSNQAVAINYCRKNKIPYAIESDTPLHIPENRLKALLKKVYLKMMLHNKYCYGFPGGTLQKENLMYYGIPSERNFIMPMSVSKTRILREKNRLQSRQELKNILGLDEKKVYLYVGRLEKEKNVNLLIEAFKIAKRKYEEIALLIVGDGTEREALEKIVKSEKIKDVIFSGYILFPEIIKYYKAADYFVLPSKYEPWGLVVNEALTLGIPTIVSDAVGCRRDLIIEGGNGRIFQSENVNDLAKKIISIQSLKMVGNPIEQWDYQTYLIKFKEAVENICEN